MSALLVRDGVGTVTISNPPTRNALDNPTRQAVLAALRDAATDPNCAAIVITGDGDTFCAGGELASMPTEEGAIRARLGEMHDIARVIHAGPKPVVAAVDGFAFGSGLSIAAACDTVLATARARFGCSFGRVGLVADSGLLWTLQQRVGASAARRILLEGRTLEAEDAAAIGLVDEIVAVGALRDRAVAWARSFVDAAPGAVAATKQLLSRSRGSLDELLADELNAQVELLASTDFAEGRAAFLEKRAPVFGPHAD